MTRRRTRTALRIAALAVTAGLAGAALTGCGSSQSGADAKQTIRFAWWGDQTRAATTKKVLAGFHKAHPNITVTTETSDFDSYFDKLATETAAQDAPDVMTLGGSYPREYSDRGALLDLATVREQLPLSGFPKSTLQSGRFTGTLYGVPTGGNAIGVLVNPAVFAKAGVQLPDTDTWTWEQFAAAAAAVTKGSPKGTYGYEPRAIDVLGVYSQQRGPAVYDAKGKVSVAASTGQAYWTMVRSMLASQAIPPASTIQETATAAPEQTLTGQGKAAMTITYSNLLSAYSAAAGTPLRLVSVPGESEYANPGTTVLPSQYYAISSQSSHQQAAALLIDYLVSNGAAGRLIKDDRGFPFDSAVVKAITPELDQYGKANSAFLAKVAKNGAPAVAIPPAGASAQNDITSKLDSDVLFGRTTPAAAGTAWVSQLKQAVASGGS